MCEDKTTIVSGYMETFLNINFTAWPTCLFTMSRKKIIILLLTIKVSNKDFLNLKYNVTDVIRFIYFLPFVVTKHYCYKPSIYKNRFKLIWTLSYTKWRFTIFLVFIRRVKTNIWHCCCSSCCCCFICCSYMTSTWVARWYNFNVWIEELLTWQSLL